MAMPYPTRVEAAVRSLALQNVPFRLFVHENILGSVLIPTDFDIAASPLVLFHVRGGDPDFSSMVLRPSMQFRSFGQTEAVARETDEQLYAALQDQVSNLVISAEQEVIGQLLVHPETKWPYMLSFYRFQIRNGS